MHTFCQQCIQVLPWVGCSSQVSPPEFEFPFNDPFEWVEIDQPKQWDRECVEEKHHCFLCLCWKLKWLIRTPLYFTCFNLQLSSGFLKLLVDFWYIPLDFLYSGMMFSNRFVVFVEGSQFIDFSSFNLAIWA